MAATFTNQASNMTTQMGKAVLGFGMVQGVLSLGDTYATNGVAVTASLFGLTTITDIIFTSTTVDGTTSMEYIPTGGLVKAYSSSTASEVGNGTDLSAAVKGCSCIVIGQ